MASGDLAANVQYNARYRPGRAYVVDGTVVLRGIGVSDALLDLACRDMAALPSPTSARTTYR